jgi:hypothetical protein
VNVFMKSEWYISDAHIAITTVIALELIYIRWELKLLNQYSRNQSLLIYCSQEKCLRNPNNMVKKRQSQYNPISNQNTGMYNLQIIFLLIFS